MRIRNMQEFYRYPDMLRHSSSLIEHLARTCLAGYVPVLLGNPAPGVSAHELNDRQRVRELYLGRGAA